MKDESDSQLLRAYADQRSEPAFAELVRRHVDLVHSAALRMVRDPHRAQDVTQGVFLALARSAAQLSDRPVLSGWLHRTARNIAAQAVRTEVRRQTREQEAAAMNELLSAEPETNWEQVAPLLDDALGELSEPDRDALLLRYFERKSAREMAQTLGVSDEAAQRRVSRAIERLRKCFARRGVAVGGSGLCAVISTNAVQAAPAGLAGSISAAAALAATTLATTTTLTATQAIAMTTLQKALVTATVAVLAGVGIYEARQAADLRHQNDTLKKEQTTLAAQVAQIQQERDAGTQQLARLSEELARLRQQPTEVHKLRGQVGVLRQEKDDVERKKEAIERSSALSKITADPETRKLMREQQKMGMSTVYGDLLKRLDLTPELAGRFKDLLADHVMNNIDLVTQALQDNRSTAEIDQMFSAQEAALQTQLRGLLGPEGLAQYEDYSKQILNSATASQFASNLTGDKQEVAGKKQQLLAALQEESRNVLANAGLPTDYQTVPMLNFRNIASEEQSEFSLRLLDSIYAGAASRATAFLSEEELKRFQEFRTKAEENNRTMLTINRKMMAPLGQ